MICWKPSSVPNAGFAIVRYDMVSSSISRPRWPSRGDATSGDYPRTSAEFLIALLIAPGAHPCGDLRAVGEVELGEDVLHMVLRGAFGDEQSFRDLAVREPFGHHPCDLVPTGGEDPRRWGGVQSGEQITDRF